MFRKHSFTTPGMQFWILGPYISILYRTLEMTGRAVHSTMSLFVAMIYTIGLIWPLISCWACCTNFPLPNGFQIYLYHCLAHVLPSSYIHVDLRMWGWQCGQHLNWRMFSRKSTYSVQVLTPKFSCLICEHARSVMTKPCICSYICLE